MHEADQFSLFDCDKDGFIAARFAGLSGKYIYKFALEELLLNSVAMRDGLDGAVVCLHQMTDHVRLVRLNVHG